jgi:hypothetical protein
LIYAPAFKNLVINTNAGVIELEWNWYLRKIEEIVSVLDHVRQNSPDNCPFLPKQNGAMEGTTRDTMMNALLVSGISKMGESLLISSKSRELNTEISFMVFCDSTTFSKQDHGRSPFITYLL